MSRQSLYRRLNQGHFERKVNNALTSGASSALYPAPFFPPLVTML